MFEDLLRRLGIQEVNSGACYGKWIEKPGGGELVSYNPANGKPLARVMMASTEDYEVVRNEAAKAFKTWRMVPAPKRGEIIRQLGNALREHKEDLGMLVTLEMGKIKTEGLGEVQEMIDMCDFAVGLSRQLYGLTIQSERPEHRMFEQWHPLGVIGIISAFNFPVAVWSWNAAIAAVCGDTMIWKPSSETPLTAIAVQHICNRIMEANGLSGIFTLTIGRGSSVGEAMIHDRNIPLISATGSCQMGYRIGEVMGKRLARTILELGGNNAIILNRDADLDMALRAVLFAAVGTAGQRCTSLRRLIIHKDVEKGFLDRLMRAYGSISIGDPWDEKNLMGPLVNEGAIKEMERALQLVREQGGEILCGGKRLDREGHYITPAIVKARPDMKIVQDETFAPILYVLPFEDIEEALEIHNGVVQGLSSAIFTNNFQHAETFLSPRGSDCGIANVNIGTSGAEIGGAFGGEKETGGGREAGSDSWKVYMRRQTCTLNWGASLPLAQGVKFDVEG
ncbi:MAG TPA: aldehyde dehydrogenase family protein [Thermoanaerobaculia bacterium]|nr:aldehyde dehydrogenase family protein [Thermoanaerobaculia bacterium]HUM29917.1 aldehyde dehydrogenase family protein [Thermoanaerobaculia bacterium]HXK68216.1 aldehyde dehydrogenase family protein [Thermoanaerobaculia bacterium]